MHVRNKVKTYVCKDQSGNVCILGTKWEHMYVRNKVGTYICKEQSRLCTLGLQRCNSGTDLDEMRYYDPSLILEGLLEKSLHLTAF